MDEQKRQEIEPMTFGPAKERDARADRLYELTEEDRENDRECAEIIDNTLAGVEEDLERTWKETKTDG